MRGRRGVVLAVGTAVLVTLAVALVVHQLREPDPGSAGRGTDDVTAVVPGRTVHVESGVPSTRFLPLGAAPRDGRTLTAQHAYNALVQDPAKLYPIPATVRAYYGVLTDASASPAAVHVRVWGFAVEAGCASTGGPPRAEASPGHRTHCRLWEFVDARTGRDLGVISQEVLPE